MIPLALAFVLAAAPAQPVAPRPADLALVVRSPRAALPALRAFLSAAGAQAPALRPAEIGRALGAPLGADLLDAASLEAAGIDPDLPLTVTSHRGALVVCVSTRGDLTASRLAATKPAVGEPASLAHKGAALSGSAVGKAWRSGFAKKGGRLCFASGASDVLPALEGAAEALSGTGLAADKGFAAATQGFSGAIVGFARRSSGTVGFELVPTESELAVRGRLFGAPALDKPRDGDPLAGFAPKAPFFARALLTRRSLADRAGPVAGALRFLVHATCPRCEPAVAFDLLDALAPRLAGSVALTVAGVDPTAATVPYGDYFLAPHAYLIPLKDPAQAQAQVAAALDKMAAAGSRIAASPPGPDGARAWTVGMGGRDVFVGFAGPLLVLANNAAARQLALAAAAESAPGKAPHAARAVLDGPLVAAALRKVSILDAARSPALAALFAAAIEAGALLRSMDPVAVEIDPEGTGARFESRLRVRPQDPPRGIPAAPAH